MIQLRDYQHEAVQAVQRDWQEYTDVLVVAATGAGKTEMFTAILIGDGNGTPGVLEDGKRALILSHRTELVDQPIWRMRSRFPHLEGKLGAVIAGRDECAAQIVSASVQTLSRGSRLQRILECGPVDYLVTDEAHHAEASTYQGVYRQLREANPNLRHLGVTATPVRADGKGLVGTFQRVSYKVDIKDLVRMGYLVRPRWQVIDTGISLAGVRSVAGDFNAKQLAHAFETPAAFDLIVQSHREYAHERTAVVFCISVNGAHELTHRFCEAGYTAACVYGGTPHDERRDILGRFSVGELQIVCNVGVLTEGYDNPRISAIHMARPTRSDGLYIQCMGRGLRLADGKEDCLILDYAPEEKRRVTFAGDVLGQAPEDKGTSGEMKPTGEIEPKQPKKPKRMKLRVKVDYLSDDTQLAWYEVEPGVSLLHVGKSDDGTERVLILEGDDEHVTLTGYGRKGRDQWQGRVLLADVKENALARAWRVCEKHGQARQYEPRAWQEQEASVGQVDFLERIGGKYVEGMTKGECSAAISWLLVQRGNHE